MNKLLRPHAARAVYLPVFARLACVVAAGTLLVASLATGAPDEEKPQPAEPRLAEVLEEKTSLDSKGMTVEKLAETLQQKYSIHVDVDIPALADVSLTKDSQLTSSFKAQPLGRGLVRILSKDEMGYFVRDDLLTITSSEKAAGSLATRLYDVGDLAPGRPADPLVIPDGEWLVSLVTSTVQPPTWDATGGPGSIRWARGILIVTQTESIQYQVIDLLTSLRTARDRQQAGDERPFWIDGALLEARRKLLDQRCTVDFQNQPLAKVMETLANNYQVSIEIDHEALEDVGTSPDTPVTARYRNITLGSALRVMLRSIDLTYRWRDDVLVITSLEKASEQLEIVLYPVRGLIKLMSPDGELPQDKTACFDELESMITTCIEPPTWETTGGPGSIKSVEELDLLVFAQTQGVHEQVDKLLTKLRAIYMAQKKREEKPAQADDSPTTVVYPLVGPEGGTPPDGFAREVADIVRKLVTPDSWKDEKTGGWIGVIPHRLVVRHKQSVHREVAQLLKKLGVLDPNALARPQVSGQRGTAAF